MEVARKQNHGNVDWKIFGGFWLSLPLQAGLSPTLGQDSYHTI